MITVFDSLDGFNRFYAGIGGQKIAFVPTMGNLHDGHLSLVKYAKTVADVVVVSIFVNPKQFAPNEDFNTYPRTLRQDVDKLGSLDFKIAVYAPEIKDIYPQQPMIEFAAPKLANCLCGLSRPHFFNGVMQVVYRLLRQVRPHVAIFGEKDYQQYLIIRQMCAELLPEVMVLSGKIVRETNGLAMSSRNGYFTAEQRQKLGIIYKTLCDVKTSQCTLSTAKQNLIDFGFKIDYLEFRDENTLMPTENNATSRLFFAGNIHNIRLIDNV